MEMERRGTAIGLLMLSLVALLLVGAAAAAAEDIIRLPGDDPLRETSEWPWECCDRGVCRESFPPQCTCRDVGDKCYAACKNCEKVESGFVCLDFFPGTSGAEPERCTGA